jgi:hypothetical protein
MSSRPDATEQTCPELPPPANQFAALAILLGLATLYLGLWTVGPAILSGLLGVWHARCYSGEKWPALLGIGLASAGVVLHVVIWPIWSQHQKMSADRVRDENGMKWIGLGVHSYQETTGSLPKACYWTGPGPLPDPSQTLSWRVELLPYMEFQNLYQAMKLNEPWDSPANRPLADQTNAYGSWSDPMTRYRVFYGNGAAFELHRPVKPEEITDGTANTVLFVQAGQQVPWPQCNELPFDPAGPLPPLGRPDRKWFLAAMADGSVRTVRKDVDPNVMKAAITRASGEPPPDW